MCVGQWRNRYSSSPDSHTPDNQRVLGLRRVIVGGSRSGIAVPPGEHPCPVVAVVVAAALGSLAGRLVGAGPVCWIGTLAEVGHGWSSGTLVEVGVIDSPPEAGEVDRTYSIGTHLGAGPRCWPGRTEVGRARIGKVEEVSRD